MSRSMAAFSGQLRIEQIDRDAADRRLPDARHDIAPGDAHAHRDPQAVRLAQRLDRQIARVVLAILRVLHAVVVDALGKKPWPYKSPTATKFMRSSLAALQ